MSRKNKKKNYTGIAIIGNGFDKAHGYATGYDDFIKAVGDAYFDEYKELLRDYCGTDLKWSDFEERVGCLAAEFYQRFLMEPDNYDQVRKDLFRFNLWFQDLHEALAEYLRKEIARKEQKKIRSINRVLKRKTLAVNFNYTSTVDCYQSPVIHVHGSLRENDIVLGFDPPSAGCMISYENNKWHKELRRNNLQFHRYVRVGIDEGRIEADYDELISGYEEIVAISTSGKGFEDEDINGWEHEKIYRDFLKRAEGHNEQEWDAICLDKVKKLFVIGHGIIADKEYLLSLMRKCTRLRKVVIFSYEGEPQAEWQQKADFFKPFCKKIVKRRYTRLKRRC